MTASLTASGVDPYPPTGGRNMLINGNMQVWQRATGTTTMTSTHDTVDRWKLVENTSAGAATSEKHAMSLAEINTTGHANALQLNCTTVDTSIAAGDYSYFFQHIEAQNCQHLQWGTAAAQTVTLSFWVKSNKTGTYCAGLVKNDTTTYFVFAEYTIDSADTWEQKTITFTPTAGSTTLITSAGGIVVNDNGHGIQIQFGLTWGTTYGSGTAQTWNASSAYYASTNQVNWMDSTSNNFYLTGVQLEAGSVATPFEHRSYGDVLAKCERYYWKQTNRTQQEGHFDNIAGSAIIKYWYPVTMRVAPTTSFTDGASTATKATYHNGAVSSGAQHNLTTGGGAINPNEEHIITGSYTGYDVYVQNYTADAEL